MAEPSPSHPASADTATQFDVGVNLMLDGRTGAVLQTYFHSEPQAGSIFGSTLVNQPQLLDAVLAPMTTSRHSRSSSPSRTQTCTPSTNRYAVAMELQAA
jgi:hypothetical protein